MQIIVNYNTNEVEIERAGRRYSLGKFREIERIEKLLEEVIHSILPLSNIALIKIDEDTTITVGEW